MNAPRHARRHAPLLCLLAVSVALGPGCLLGSPLAAIGGEPYGMTRDDVSALQGKKGKIWSGAAVFAFFDLPVAFVLDTAFLPISLLIWGITAIAESGDDERDAHSDHDHDQTDSGGTHRGGDSQAAQDRWDSQATD